MLLAGLLLLAPSPALAAPPQNGAGAGAESLARLLEERTVERRAVAARVWQEHGTRWLEQADLAAREALLAVAPEIETPLLEALWSEAAAAAPSADRVLGVVTLLGEAMDPAGADRLVAGHERLPAPLRLAALEAALARGGTLAEAAIDRFLAGDRSAVERSRALAALLRHGEAARAERRLAGLPWTELDAARLGRGLEDLAARPDLPAEFRLPEELYAQLHPALVGGVLAVLEHRPDRRAEDFLSGIARLEVASAEQRKRALAVAEAGVAEFRWRRFPRDLALQLRDRPEDPLAEPLAWALHRLGEREGTKFLVDGLERELKSNPQDYRVRFRLASRYVELGMFKEGYKEFHTGILELEGTPLYSRIDRTTWLDAARSACGSKRYTEGLDWLRNARMSPRELEQFRALPEFEAALTKSAFRKVFGLE